MIRHLRHSEIDKVAWDAHLARCPNKLWYGLSSTLDAASPGWDALIDEANGSRLALPWRRKYGIRYLYQPFLLQQLGPWALEPSPLDTARFVQALPSSFRFADIYLCTGDSSLTGLSEQRNITIDLHRPIGEIRHGYSENHRRNLRKPMAADAVWDDGVPIDELEEFLVSSEQFKRWGIDARRIATMRRIMKSAVDGRMAITCGIRHQGALVAAGFFVHWGGRLIFLKGLASQQGRAMNAMHHLLDRVIADHAGKDLILDLAGTNDPDLARFYLGFGGTSSVYLRALINKLPAFLRFLKR